MKSNTTHEIISFANLKTLNKNLFNITSVSHPEDICENSITLITRVEEFGKIIENAPKAMIAVIPETWEIEAKKYNQTFILSENPRLTFAQILLKYFVIKQKSEIGRNTIVESDKEIHSSISIGSNCSINGSVSIGPNCRIHDNVVINGRVDIGKNVVIKSGTVIGQKGFNFPLDNKKIPVALPHFGSVILGDNIEIGALTTVVQGTLGDTVISNNVKIDDHVHIAHNVKIGENTLITACAVIAGSVIIGSNVYIAPSSTIIDHINIGNNVLVGIGSVVMRNIKDGVTVLGNPAIKIR